MIASDLIETYDYAVRQRLDAHRLLRLDVNNQATLRVWILHMTPEFDRMAVLMHSRLHDQPTAAPEAQLVISELRVLNVKQLLIFANASDFDVVAPCRPIAEELWTIPHGLGMLSYNLLTVTLTYLNHRERIHWKVINCSGGER